MKSQKATQAVGGLSASHNLSFLFSRLAIAIVMWPHGAQQLLGWFGGFGFSGTMNYFTQTVGLPYFIAVMVIYIQFFGSLMILFGWFIKTNAILMGVIVVGMIFSGHVEHGFFMNWAGNQAGEGFEFHILLLGLCISLLLSDKQKFSIDYLLHSKPSQTT